MKIIWIALLGVGLMASSAAGASKGGSVALVAYSTPKDAYGQIISSFQKTSVGNGSSFSQSYGASGDQARALARPRHQHAGRQGPRPQELGGEQVQGRRLRLGRRLRRARRQPQAHQDL